MVVYQMVLQYCNTGLLFSYQGTYTCTTGSDGARLAVAVASSPFSAAVAASQLPPAPTTAAAVLVGMVVAWKLASYHSHRSWLPWYVHMYQWY